MEAPPTWVQRQLKGSASNFVLHDFANPAESCSGRRQEIPSFAKPIKSEISRGAAATLVPARGSLSSTRVRREMVACLAEEKCGMRTRPRTGAHLIDHSAFGNRQRLGQSSASRIVADGTPWRRRTISSEFPWGAAAALGRLAGSPPSPWLKSTLRLRRYSPHRRTGA
ncbi:hypothetical protein KM043_017431 [Ampulex compressa]|nr:hypothetical protein KM043_017431 [Ampulex compressa]